MIYEKERELKIKIIEAIQEAEENEEIEQLNATQEAELSERIFNKLKEDLK